MKKNKSIKASTEKALVVYSSSIDSPSSKQLNSIASSLIDENCTARLSKTSWRARLGGLFRSQTKDRPDPIETAVTIESSYTSSLSAPCNIVVFHHHHHYHHTMNDTKPCYSSYKKERLPTTWEHRCDVDLLTDEKHNHYSDCVRPTEFLVQADVQALDKTDSVSVLTFDDCTDYGHNNHLVNQQRLSLDPSHSKTRESWDSDLSQKEVLWI